MRRVRASSSTPRLASSKYGGEVEDRVAHLDDLEALARPRAAATAPAVVPVPKRDHHRALRVPSRAAPAGARACACSGSGGRSRPRRSRRCRGSARRRRRLDHARRGDARRCDVASSVAVGVALEHVADPHEVRARVVLVQHERARRPAATRTRPTTRPGGLDGGGPRPRPGHVDGEHDARRTGPRRTASARSPARPSQGHEQEADHERARPACRGCWPGTRARRRRPGRGRRSSAHRTHSGKVAPRRTAGTEEQRGRPASAVRAACLHAARSARRRRPRPRTRTISSSRPGSTTHSSRNRMAPVSEEQQAERQVGPLGARQPGTRGAGCRGPARR